MSDLVISSYQNELWHLVHDAIHQMLANINNTIRIMEENTDSRVVMMECCRQLQTDLLKLEDDAAAETFLIEKLLETAQRIMEQRNSALAAYQSLVALPNLPMDKVMLLKLAAMPESTRASVLWLIDMATHPQTGQQDANLRRLFDVLDHLSKHGL